jgi:hypothetical protein
MAGTEETGDVNSFLDLDMERSFTGKELEQKAPAIFLSGNGGPRPEFNSGSC